MKKTFVTLLNEFIDVNGKRVFENPNRFIALFLDYTQNEYRAETQVFSKFIASKQALELKSNNDVDNFFLKSIAERFQKETLFEKDICEMVVFAYARFMGIIEKNTFETEKNRKSDNNTENISVIKSVPVENKKTKWPLLIIGIIVVIISAILLYNANSGQSGNTNPPGTTATISNTIYTVPQMAMINGGTFIIDESKNPFNRDGRTERRLTVSTFFISRNKITIEEYQGIMNINPTGTNATNQPVVNVSFFDVLEYCNRLSMREGLTPAYAINEPLVTWNENADGYRLAIKDEFNYICFTGQCDNYDMHELGEWGWDLSTGSSNNYRLVFKQCHAESYFTTGWALEVYTSQNPYRQDMEVGFRIARNAN